MLTFGEFIVLVIDMRQAQKDHRSKSSRANLRRRHSLEHQVDTAVAAYLAEDTPAAFIFGDDAPSTHLSVDAI